MLDELSRSAGALAFYQARWDESDGPNGLLVRSMFGSRPSTWLQLWNDERDRMTRISSAALKTGIEERRLQLTQVFTVGLDSALQRSIDRLGLEGEAKMRAQTMLFEELKVAAQNNPETIQGFSAELPAV